MYILNYIYLSIYLSNVYPSIYLSIYLSISIYLTILILSISLSIPALCIIWIKISPLPYPPSPDSTGVIIHINQTGGPGSHWNLYVNPYWKIYRLCSTFGGCAVHLEVMQDIWRCCSTVGGCAIHLEVIKYIWRLCSIFGGYAVKLEVIVYVSAVWGFAVILKVKLYSLRLYCTVRD